MLHRVLQTWLNPLVLGGQRAAGLLQPPAQPPGLVFEGVVTHLQQAHVIE
jgi:hypothetical protein